MSASEDVRKILEGFKVNRTRQGTSLSKPEVDRLAKQLIEEVVQPLEEQIVRKADPKPKPMWNGFMLPEGDHIKDLKKMDVVEKWATDVGVTDERKVLSVTLRDENDKAYAYYYTYVTSAGSHQMWLVHDDNVQELDLDFSQFSEEDGEISEEEQEKETVPAK